MQTHQTGKALCGQEGRKKPGFLLESGPGCWLMECSLAGPATELSHNIQSDGCGFGDRAALAGHGDLVIASRSTAAHCDLHGGAARACDGRGAEANRLLIAFAGSRKRND